MTSAATPLMTTDELLAIPDDGVDRELIRGELREYGMTRRNKDHGFSEATIATLLNIWLRQQTEPRGGVYSGETGARLRTNPDTTVGIDVAYFSSQTVEASDLDARFMEGPPVLAVEILSPSDQQNRLNDKVDEYLASGVQSVWIVDPKRRTVTVHRPDTEPVLFNATQTLTDDHLPGFAANVAELFG